METHSITVLCAKYIFCISVSEEYLTTCVLTFLFLGFSITDLCQQGFLPYSCTFCIEFTKETVTYDSACATTALVEVESSNEMELLHRYMEVFNISTVWVKSNKTRMNGGCSEECCSALQLDPLELISVDCDTKLSAICSTDLNGKSYMYMMLYSKLIQLYDLHVLVFMQLSLWMKDLEKS